MIQKNLKKENSGFALLLTLVVVSVVLAIGLSLIDTTLKQLVLSGIGRDGEIAFHAAYAGAECAHYWRLQSGDQLLAGTAPTLDGCLSGTPELGIYTRVVQDVHLAEYEISWGTAPQEKCTQIDMYLYDARNVAVGDTLDYDISYYRDATEVCEGGNVCTLIFSRGYNRACSDIGSIRTVQQEVVLHN